jgi:uncharacterized protein YecT (DUF1311 family)
MRFILDAGVILALAGCASRGQSMAQPASAETSKEASPPPVTQPATSSDPCGSESTTLAIESCVSANRQQVEAEIQASLTRFAGVLRGRGVADADALVAASQTDWERYRNSQCQLHEKLSEGGSLARIAVAYCRQDLAQARLSSLRALEHSVLE